MKVLFYHNINTCSRGTSFFCFAIIFSTGVWCGYMNLDVFWVKNCIQLHFFLNALKLNALLWTRIIRKHCKCCVCILNAFKNALKYLMHEEHYDVIGIQILCKWTDNISGYAFTFKTANLFDAKICSFTDLKNKRKLLE